MKNSKLLSFPPLRQNISTEIAVIGAGIAGVTTAYLLAKQGKKVVLIEANEIGSGETSRTTSHLSCSLSAGYADLEKIHGFTKARLIAESHLAAIDLIEEIVKTEHINCDFERLDGYLFLHPSDRLKTLEEELIITRKIGLETKMVDKAPLGFFDTGKALCFPRQAQFQAFKYIQKISNILAQKGVKIYTQTYAESIKRKQIKTTNGQVITAENIVVATNVPRYTKFSFHGKQAAYRTYALAAKIPPSKMLNILLWDTGDQNKPCSPYHYIRTEKVDGENRIVIGGEDHKTGQGDPEKAARTLRTWAKQNFGITKINGEWSGQVVEPIDGIAYIGETEKGMYIITGDAGNGLTHGTLGAMLVSDLILGKKNAWEEVYDPRRKTIRAIGNLIRETTNVLGCYCDYLHSDRKSPSKLEKGEGMVVRRGVNPLAIYKDEKGNVNTYSAICPHLQGVVRWNSQEKTFDCPCHGSRFDSHGEVINGPSNKNLKKIKPKISDY